MNGVSEVHLSWCSWSLNPSVQFFDNTMSGALHRLKFPDALELVKIISYDHDEILRDDVYVAQVQAEVKKIFGRRTDIKVEVELRGRNHVHSDFCSLLSLFSMELDIQY
jgi:hypothetical protein